MKTKHIWNTLSVGLIIVMASFLVWKAYHWTPPVKKGKKLTLKGEIDQLIESLQSCPREAEKYFCRRLRTLTGLNFNYEVAANRQEEKKALKGWIEWWQKYRDLSPRHWLAKMAADPSYPHREEALIKLKSHPPFPAGKEILIDIARKEKNPLHLRRRATLLLGHWKVKKGRQLYLSLLEESHPLLVEGAIRALGKTGQGFEAILPKSKASSPRVREAALQALYEISSTRARPHLIEALGDEALPVRIYAVSALREELNREELAQIIEERVSSPAIQKELLNLLPPPREK